MGTGMLVTCEELLKGNGISGGTARVSWWERELLIGQNHILFYFIFSCLFKIQNNYYQRSHSWVLECKLNPYWSKLRLREKHDVILFSFFTCPLIPKTLLTQKSDSIFVHRLLRYSIFPHISLIFLFPLTILTRHQSSGLTISDSDSESPTSLPYHLVTSESQI